MKVYIKKISYTDNIDNLKNLLSNEKQHKIEKLKKEEDQKKSVISTLLLNDILKLNGLDSSDVVYNEYGKPYLKNNEFNFNISHSGDYVVCVISKNEIGIDIQQIRKINDLIVQKKFTVSEQEYVKDDLTFTRVWTLKESYIKAIGKGLYQKLEDVETIKNNYICKIENYQFQSMVIDDYCLSICYNRQDRFKIEFNYI